MRRMFVAVVWFCAAAWKFALFDNQQPSLGYSFVVWLVIFAVSQAHRPRSRHEADRRLGIRRRVLRRFYRHGDCKGQSRHRHHSRSRPNAPLNAVRCDCDRTLHVAASLRDATRGGCCSPISEWREPEWDREEWSRTMRGWPTRRHPAAASSPRPSHKHRYGGGESLQC